ncbi:hypothetical protein BGZ46_009082 [Entomortierella lignicola]|nr:hypothetical protein BGZ46_009082 [Entomortierella lignicola]
MSRSRISSPAPSHRHIVDLCNWNDLPDATSASVAKIFQYHLFTLAEATTAKEQPCCDLNVRFIKNKSWQQAINFQAPNDVHPGVPSYALDMGSPERQFIKAIYTNIELQHIQSEFLAERAILTPYNKEVDRLNNLAMEMLTGPTRTYLAQESQGQTLNTVGIYQPRQEFSRGQFKVLINKGNLIGREEFYSRNIVYSKYFKRIAS